MTDWNHNWLSVSIWQYSNKYLCMCPVKCKIQTWIVIRKPSRGLPASMVGSHLGLKCLLMTWQLMTRMQICVKWNHNLPTQPPQPTCRNLCDTEIHRNPKHFLLCVSCLIKGRQCCSGFWRLNKALLLILAFIWRHPDQILAVYGAIQNSWHRLHHFDLIRRQTNQLLDEPEIFLLPKKPRRKYCQWQLCTSVAGARITEIPVHLGQKCDKSCDKCDKSCDSQLHSIVGLIK